MFSIDSILVPVARPGRGGITRRGGVAAQACRAGARALLLAALARRLAEPRYPSVAAPGSVSLSRLYIWAVAYSSTAFRNRHA
jgi:hypothetical protein